MTVLVIQSPRGFFADCYCCCGFHAADEVLQGFFRVFDIPLAVIVNLTDKVAS